MQQETNIYEQLSAINPNKTSYTVCFDESDEENDPINTSDTISNSNNLPVVNNTQGSSKELNTKDDTNSLVTHTDITVANSERNNLLLNISNSKYAHNQDNCRKRKNSSETDKENCAKIIREDRCIVINEKDENDKTVAKQLSKQGKEAKEGSESEKIGTIKNTILHTHNSQNTDPTIVQCYKNLLKTVSEHLIEIAHTFDSNAKEIIDKHLSGTAESRKSWSRCLRKKQELFNLSYCTVLNVILPQKQNEKFIDDFISDSCNLVSANGKTCTYSRMKQLVTEMIEWTEKKSRMKNENNVKNINKTLANPNNTLPITISDDEEEDETKPIILTLTQKECDGQIDKELSQSIQNEGILSYNHQNSAIEEKDPLEISTIRKTYRPIDSVIYIKSPLINSGTDEADPLNKYENYEKVPSGTSTIVENDPLQLDEKNITSPPDEETVSVDQVYSTLSNDDSAQIEKCLSQSNLVQDIQEYLRINQNDGSMQRIQVNYNMQDSAMFPSNQVLTADTQQKTTLDQDNNYSLECTQQAPSQLFHYPSKPTPVQAPKISVRSEQDLGLSHQHSLVPTNSDPNLLGHQLSTPHFVPYRPPVIYNQTIVNRQNSTVIQHDSVAQGQLIPLPLNQNYPRVSPQYNTFIPTNSLRSEMYNQNSPLHPASLQYTPQTSALPPVQQYFKPPQYQLMGSKVQNYAARHNTTSQNNTRNKNHPKARKTNEKSNTVQPNLSDPRHNDKQSENIDFSDVLNYSSNQPQLKEPSFLQQYLNQISTDRNYTSKYQLQYNQQNQVSTQQSSPQSQQQFSQGMTWYSQSVSTSTAQPLSNSVAQQQPNMLRPPPPPYTNRSSSIHTPEQQIQISIQPNEQMQNIRSISTDSGIMSPLNFNSTTPPGPVVNDSTALDNLGPMITHVTSLNPNAKYHPTQQCYMCKAQTRKKCLGCLQVYYCSVGCQSAHWRDHGIHCGRT